VQFLTFDEAQVQPSEAEYRYRVVTVAVMLLVTNLAIIAAGIGAYWAWTDAAYIAVFIAGCLLFAFGVFTLVIWSMLRARLQPANWLVRTQTGGILVKYRSYWNYHFPPGDPVVAFISFSEIEWIREHRIDRKVRSMGVENGIERFRYVELKLRDTAALKELDARLAFEHHRLPERTRHWYGSVRISSNHYPVQISTEWLVRINWEVHPRAKQFLTDLGQHVAKAADLETDFKQPTRLFSLVIGLSGVIMLATGISWVNYSFKTNSWSVGIEPVASRIMGAIFICIALFLSKRKGQ
jgi:hypothetical protein